MYADFSARCSLKQAKAKYRRSQQLAQLLHHPSELQHRRRACGSSNGRSGAVFWIWLIALIGCGTSTARSLWRSNTEKKNDDGEWVEDLSTI